jgi:hypothetical protein
MRKGEATRRGAQLGSVEVGDKPSSARKIGFVFGPERVAEQSLLRLDAREYDGKHQHRDDDVDARAER